jgi:hypothetical protein
MVWRGRCRMTPCPGALPSRAKKLFSPQLAAAFQVRRTHSTDPSRPASRYQLLTLAPDDLVGFLPHLAAFRSLTSSSLVMRERPVSLKNDNNA